MTGSRRIGRLLAAATTAALIAGSAGCAGGMVFSPAGPPAGTGQARPAVVRTGTGRLITEPGAGFGVVYRLIGRARHSIDLTVYELADTTAEHDLAAAARRGVRVRVILDHHERYHNQAAFSYLRARRVRVVWSSPRYTYTHQKTLVTDGGTAVIMTANLTSRYYPTSRDFLVTDTSKADIAAITATFDADFAGRAIRPAGGRDLVWSPTSAQAKLLALIDGARHSLRVYFEEMADTTIENALIRAARRGVRVQVCGENGFGDYDRDFARLARAGVAVSYFSSSHGLYIHAKVVEADFGTPRAAMFVGSENFSVTSLTANRELGLIISSRAALASVARTFATDFGRGKRWH
ncbi:MAG TPA: phospholipase D-like domain-containing protein [Streptosporangiaceae bacterium]